MLNETDFDLEDLEARLYSQVYHGCEENQQPDSLTDRVEYYEILDNQNPGRYYKMGNYIKQNFQRNFLNNSSNSANSSVPLVNSVDPRLLYGSPLVTNPEDSSPLIPQVVNMVNPYNNIVVLPQATPHFLTSTVLQPYINKNLEKFLKRQNVRLKRSMRRKIQKERKRKGKSSDITEVHTMLGMDSLNDKNLKNTKPIEAEEPNEIPIEIIESDSDNSCCIVTKEENSLIILSSDESVDVDFVENNTPKSKKNSKKSECNANNLIESKNLNEVDEDVIFVEPKPVEIIEIDIDSPQSVVNLDVKTKADTDASKQQDIDKLTEISSSNPIDTSKHSNNVKTKQELWNMPDSTTSNDFLVNPIEVLHNRFNFGLHDSDFANSQIFLKPKCQAEAYETESSCSTSDVSSTPIKTALFNEVEFETPSKQLFDDTNLEGFGNYITPNRSGSSGIPSILTTDFEQVETKVKTKRDLQFDSDFSDNDFDCSKSAYIDTKIAKQVLPNLCPISINSDCRDVPKGKISKGKKKKLSNLFNDESTVKQAGNKRKSDFETNDDSNETQKKTKTRNNQVSDLNNSKCDENKSDNIGDNAVVNTKKPNQNESKRNKIRKDSKDHSEPISEKDVTGPCYVTTQVDEETKIKNKQVEVKNVIENCSHKKLNSVTTNSNAEVDKVMRDDAESAVIKETLVENTLENMVTSNFIVLDETFDGKNNTDVSLFSPIGNEFSNFEELTGDLTLANCESHSQHFVQKDSVKKRTRFADYWIANPEKFHNRSWGLENFSVEETQKSMSDDPDLWKIVDRDRVFVRLSVPKGQRCRRCREIGHIAYKCRNKPAIPSCSLCGTKGHIEPRCPNAVCTTCGNSGNYSTYCSHCAYWRQFQCTLCKVFGHFDWACPDLWRRYHLTTKPGPIVVPENTRGKLYQEKWCCNCAKFGHYEQNCRYANRVHPCTVSEVKEYVDVYNFPKIQPTITLSKSIEEIKECAEVNKNFTEEVDKQVKKASETELQPLIKKAPKNVVVIDESDGTNRNETPYPPNRMIPTYFQDQLSYLKFGKLSTSENVKVDRPLLSTSNNEMSACLLDKTLNLDEDTINKLRLGELHSKKILLFAQEFAYLFSCKGKDFVNEIRSRNNVTMIIKTCSPNASAVGFIFLYGNEKEVDIISNEFDNFLNDVAMIDISTIPKDSKSLRTFLNKTLSQFESAQGNSKVLFDSIIAKKEKMFALTNTDWRKIPAITGLYQKLNILLFGRCKLQDGEKHMATLESWLKLTKGKYFTITLEDRFDIYEAYMYVYKSLRSDDEYGTLCENANYHVSVKPTDEINKKKRLYFNKKIKEIVKNCKKFKLNNEFRQVTNIRDAVLSSNYSRTAYEDFLKYAKYFTKYFCKLNNN